MWTVIGILAALRRRDATGEGCDVDTSLFETALSWVHSHAATYLGTGQVPGRRGSEMAGLVPYPYKVFEAADGYVLITAGNDNLFRRLSAALDHPEWMDDARFATNPARVENREIVNGAVQDIVQTRPAAHWVELLDTAGVPCAPLQSVDQVVGHPQTKALEMVRDTPDGKMSLVGLPLSFDGVRPALRKGPPDLGADTGIVLGDERGTNKRGSDER